MPDYMAMKVGEAMNKKSITRGDELADALDDIEWDIVLIEPNPVDWGEWVSYLLHQMEAEAKRRGIQAGFNETLRSIQKHLDRLD